MKYGCCALLEDTDAVLKAGYDYIELPARQIQGLSEDRFQDFLKKKENLGFDVPVMNDFCDESVMLIGEKYNEKQVLSYLITLLKRAQLLGVGKIGIGAPNARSVPADYDRDKAVEEFVKCLVNMSDVAEDYGIVLMLEPINAGICNFINTMEEAEEIVRAADHCSLRLMQDFFHSEIMADDAGVSEHLGKCIHVHVSELAGGRRAYLCETNIDKYMKWAGMLCKAEYEGTVSIEIPGRQNADNLYDNLNIMKMFFTTS